MKKAKQEQERPSKGDATRQRILAVAEKVFAEVGFSTARLDDIADVVGVKRTTVLHYFKTKQDLYDMVEAGIFADMQAATRQRLAGVEDALEQLFAVFDSWLDFLVARPTGARIIMRNTADVGPRSNNPVQFSDIALTTVEEIMRKGQAAGVFPPHNPMRVVAIVGGGILQYICASHQLGSKRAYKPADKKQLEPFRNLLHQTLRGLLLKSP